MKKKILLVLAAILVLIQFIRPAKNQSTSPSPTDIAVLAPIPSNVQTILNKACNDCHSNNTYYPWYSNIQPVGWWLDHHVDEGKSELNFSEFLSYSTKRQLNKLQETIEVVKENEMPLNSYTWTHKDAILSNEEKLAISNWAENLKRLVEQKTSTQ